MLKYMGYFKCSYFVCTVFAGTPAMLSLEKNSLPSLVCVYLLSSVYLKLYLSFTSWLWLFFSVFHCSVWTNTLFYLNAVPSWYYLFSGLAVASCELHSTVFFPHATKKKAFLFTDNITDGKIGYGKAWGKCNMSIFEMFVEEKWQKIAKSGDGVLCLPYWWVKLKL